MSPTPILFTIPNFITAGSGRAMLNIIERLDRAKFAPAVCVLAKGGKLDKVVVEMGIPLLELPFLTKAKPYLSLRRRVRQLAEPFRPYQFALWHSFHYSDDYTEPLIARAAGAQAWVYTKKNMNWHRRAWQLRTLLATRVAAQNSDMLKEFFASPLHRRKAHFVPRGVIVDQFRQAQPMLGLRGQLSIPADRHLIGCVAQLLPVKGHPTLINALVQVPDAHLLLAGKPLDEQYATQLRQQVAELGLGERVTFLDFVDDIPAFLAEIDLFVLPTWARWRKEGCPVALLEAMASGCACIATDIPGSRDLVIEGVTGRLVPPEQSEPMAAAIQDLLNQPKLRQTLGEAASARVATHYTIEQEVAAHEKMYAEALGW
ncbi:MAG: glycosyltransferase family 4 protein [Anaerolineales bacterium]|nr:glycosyltransferase family 4 protein [Anaerolineales bacterium]